MVRKSFIITLLCLLFIFTATAWASSPSVILDGQELAFDVPPTIENGRTLVPLRAIFEALGADIAWDGQTQTVTATKENIEVKLTIGQAKAYCNDEIVQLDVPAKILNQRTLVPLRFVSEAMGAGVFWDGTTKTVYISPAEKTYRVHYIDVGQADCIYIELPNADDILIDAGNRADGPLVVSYLKEQEVDDIEFLIATHPHEDHIGGIPDVLDVFVVESILDSGYLTDTKTSCDYASECEAENASWQEDNYQAYSFGDVSLNILTGKEKWDNTNNYSVVCRMDTGDIEFLFMGDAEAPVEAVLTGELEAEILKVGHHGSSSSTTSSFLNKVDPEVAVICVGAGNTYGHPHQETLNKLVNAGVKVYRTDLNGHIVVTTDGTRYAVATQKSLTAPEEPVVTPPAPTTGTGNYVGSIKSDKYHLPSCSYAEKILPENRIWFDSKAEAEAAGYKPCGVCKP